MLRCGNTSNVVAGGEQQQLAGPDQHQPGQHGQVTGT